MKTHGFYKSYLHPNARDIHYRLWFRYQERHPHLKEMITVPVPPNATTIKTPPFSVWIQPHQYFARKHLQECIDARNALIPKAQALAARIEKLNAFAASLNVSYFNTLSKEEATRIFLVLLPGKEDGRYSSLNWNEVLPDGITPQMVVDKVGQTLCADYRWLGGVHTWEWFHPHAKSEKGRQHAPKI